MAGKGRPVRDRAGDRYGNLVVLAQAGTNAHKQALWLCRCDCGNEVVKSVVFFNNGGQQCTKQCPLGVHVKHGGATKRKKSKEYSAWVDMKQRCLNPNTPNYKHYGGRGVTVCAKWIDDYAAFYADVGPAPEGNRMSIDRIDVNGNYEPGNVKWSTPSEQTANRRPYKHRPGLTRTKRTPRVMRGA